MTRNQWPIYYIHRYAFIICILSHVWIIPLGTCLILPVKYWTIQLKNICLQHLIFSSAIISSTIYAFIYICSIASIFNENFSYIRVSIMMCIVYVYIYLRRIFATTSSHERLLKLGSLVYHSYTVQCIECTGNINIYNSSWICAYHYLCSLHNSSTIIRLFGKITFNFFSHLSLESKNFFLFFFTKFLCKGFSTL